MFHLSKNILFIFIDYVKYKEFTPTLKWNSDKNVCVENNYRFSLLTIASVFQLRGVTLKLSDPKSPDYLNAIRGGRDFAHSVQSHVLKFSFQNGKVEHICPSEDVPVWVTNIHKGVLSAFQTFVIQPDWSTTEEEVWSKKCLLKYESQVDLQNNKFE